MRPLLNVVALALALLATPGLADDQSDRLTCSATVRISSLEACSRLIESRNISREERFLAYFNRAWSYRRAGDNRSALADLNAAEHIEASYPNLYITRALVNEALGHSDAALVDLDRYISLEPRNWTGYYRRALIHRQRHAAKAALADLAKAIELNRYDRVLLTLRILMLSDLGNQDIARIEADKLVASRPSDPIGNYARAVVLLRQGKRADAAADLNAAIRTSPLFTAAHALKGEIAELTGDRDAARESYDLAMRVGGPDIDAESAREKARRRMAALGGAGTDPSGMPMQTDPQSRPQVVSAPGASGSTGKGECRRFVPVLATTIGVKCD